MAATQKNRRALIVMVGSLLTASLALEGTALAAGRGIDVSHHQGRIRWGRVSETGVEFAFIKATEGVGVSDPRYRENRKRASREGIEVGAYHFARPSGAKKERVRDDARREASYFLKKAAPKRGELAPVLDLETSGELNRLQLQRWTQAWLEHVYRKTGVKAIVYSGPTFWGSEMKDTRVFADEHPLWLAHYTRGRPEVPAGFWDGKGWAFWQWTDCGRVRGIRGCVDLNFSAYDDLGHLRIASAKVSGKTRRAPRRKPEPRSRSAREKNSKKASVAKRKSGSHGRKETPATRKGKTQPKQEDEKKRDERSHREAKPERVVLTRSTPLRGSRNPMSGHPERSWTRWIT